MIFKANKKKAHTHIFKGCALYSTGHYPDTNGGILRLPAV